MESKMFKNIINFPGVNFDSVLFYILHLMSVANKITGWYFGVGEAYLWDTGMASAGKKFKIRMLRQFSSSTKVKETLASVPSKTNFLPLNLDKKLNPWWVSGFSDGEGCFHISIRKNKTYKVGWRVELSFKISLNSVDIALLEQIKNLFGVGSLYFEEKSKSVNFQVRSLGDLKIIIDHFNGFPLITQKWADFQLFQQAWNLIMRDLHLTQSGLREIVAIRASMNRGLSDKLKVAFPNVKPAKRPLVKNKNVKNPYWIAGFTSAEGCFLINLLNSKQGEVVSLCFQLT